MASNTVTPRARNLQYIALLLGVVAFFTAIGVWFASRERAAADESLAPDPLGRTTAEAHALVSPTGATGERSNVIGTAADADSSKKQPNTVRGRVVDFTGAPVPDAAISQETFDPGDAPVLARTGVDGRFEFAAQETDVVLMASTSTMRTLRTQHWRVLAPAEEGVIVVAPCIDVQGVVVGEDGSPLDKVKVAVEIAEELFVRVPLDQSKSPKARDWSYRTDDQGRFQMRRAFRPPGAMILASRADYLPSRAELPREAQQTVRIVLARDPAAQELMLTGVVLRANGEPAVDASVCFGELQVSCGSRGEFRMDVPGIVLEELCLVAAEKRTQPAVLPAFGRTLRDGPRPPLPLELRLGPPTLSIRGVVLDEEGHALANAIVALIDPVLLASTAKYKSAEELAAGQTDTCRTSPHGDFALDGLFERDYRLQVVDTERLVRVETDPIRAGANGVVIRLPADCLVPEVRGRVIARDGSPLAGATVGVIVSIYRVQSSQGAQSQNSTKGRALKKVKDDGSFVLDAVPKRLADLVVDAPSAIRRLIPIEELDLSKPLEISLDRMCAVRFDGLTIGDEVHLIEALDPSGNALDIRMSTGRSWSGSKKLQLKDDPLQLYQVPETAVELVHWFPADTVCARRAIKPSPRELTIVKW